MNFMVGLFYSVGITCMTYKAHLAQLLTLSIAKSNAFIESVRVNAPADSAISASMQHDWEKTENQYSIFLNLIKCNQIDINSEMPEVA